MKTIRGFIAGLFVAGAIGGAAAATPTAHVVPKAPTSGATAPVPVPVFPSPTAESPETSDKNDSKDSSTGLTGLDNAIAHVSQNLADHPNKGLANALAHLQANLAKHQANQEAKNTAKDAVKAPNGKKWTGS